MANSLSIDDEQRLETLSERFQQWRAVKTYRSEPIPESLWTEVIALSERIPRRPLCQSLRLSETDLKKRLGLIPVQRSSPPANPTTQPMFVELSAVVGANVATPARVELAVERPDGARLQLRYSGAVAELMPMVAPFLVPR